MYRQLAVGKNKIAVVLAYTRLLQQIKRFVRLVLCFRVIQYDELDTSIC